MSKEHPTLCPCDECSYDTPCQLCYATPCEYAERISANTVIVACSNECFKKLKIVHSMAVPFRCGGATYVDGNLIYKHGNHFISQATLHDNVKTISWWDNWYATHDHQFCVEMQNKIPQRKRK